MNLREISDEVDVEYKRLYQLASNDDFPKYKIGSNYYYRLDEVINYINETEGE